MSGEENNEASVEVTFPEERDIEVGLADKEVHLDEPQAQIKEKKDKKSEREDREDRRMDERERALEELKQQYNHQKMVAEAEREARRQAEYFARQQAQQVNYAKTEVQDSNLRIIVNAIDATEQAAANAERDYSDAMAAGDYTLAAKAQRAIAQAESHLLQLNNGRQKIGRAHV